MPLPISIPQGYVWGYYYVSGVPIESHRIRFYPHGSRGGGMCCPCPAHRAHHSTPAKLTGFSGVALTRTNDAPLNVGDTVKPGEAVIVAGMVPSPSPWDATAVFEWEENNTTSTQTNAFTVADAHVIGDFDKNGFINAYDVTNSLAPPQWGMAMIPNSSRPVHLNTPELQGDHILTLTGTACAFHIRASAGGNGTILLTPGQSITNSFPKHMYIETTSLSQGATATLAYTFQGTGISSNHTYSASLTITVVGVHITMKNDYSYLPVRPVFDGTLGKKWVVATFPEPQQTNIVWDVQLLGQQSGTARLLYQRGTGAEAEIPWGNGGPHTLQFTDGWLNASVRLYDGPEPSPTMTLASGVVTISGVQQGDKIIVEETGLSLRDEIAVVKNFSWNDLQRLGSNNLTMHPDFNDLLPEIKDAIIGTILFCMDTSPTRQQKVQFDKDYFYDSGSWGTVHTDFRQNHPSLLTLEIPSARSVGLYPYDLDHFHIALETYPLPPSIIAQTNSLGEVWEAVDEQPFPIMRAALRQHFVDLLNSAYGFPNETPFLLFHTYEARETFSPAYMVSGATAYLMPGDPVRNIRWTFANPYPYPDLTYPGSETSAGAWRNISASPQQIGIIGFFVDRKGRVVLVPQGGTRAIKGMLSDALREE